MSIRRGLAPSLVALAALAACGSGPAPAASSSASATPAGAAVVASTDVYGAIAGAVGGSAVQVTSIIHSPGADPHEYESTPGDVVAVSRAQLMIYNGAGYDDFATKILEASGSRPTTINVAELSGLQAQQPPGQEFNEHVWYSFPTARRLADTLAADLGKADPGRAGTFTANAQAFDAKIDGLTARLDVIKAKHAGQRVAITEPLPQYLVHAAGLVDATPPGFAEAVEAGTEPPAAVLNASLDTVRGPAKVAALVVNAQTEGPTTRQVEEAARAAGVPIVPVTETLPAGINDYVTWMTQQVDALAAALDRR